MKYKWVFFAVSGLVILPGIFFLARYGLKLSIDFTGGTLIEIKNPKLTTSNGLTAARNDFAGEHIEIASVSPTSEGSYLFRTKTIDNAQKEKLLTKLDQTIGQTDITRFDTVGPTIGAELTAKAVQAVVLAAIMMILFIAYAFREIPQPYKSWKFGVTAVVALLHDVLVVVGLFSIFGHFFNVEIDALFITALLTVIGFSVHDTIVVFDRVRENLRKSSARTSFSQVVDESILQTLVRSLSTSITVLLTLLALILFGGETIHWFCLALFIGIFSGTYSSIFNAAPLLVLWEEKKRST